MLAGRLEADCKRLAEDIKARRAAAAQLETRLMAKERTAEVAREFSRHCRRLADAFDTLDIPRRRSF